MLIRSPQILTRPRVPIVVSSWTPASDVGLVSWYKADGTLLNGSASPASNTDNLTQWNDETGNGHHLLAADFSGGQTGQYLTSAPHNSKKAVYFNQGNNAVMYCPTFPASGGSLSIYAHVNITSSAAIFRRFMGYAAPTQTVDGVNGVVWFNTFNAPTSLYTSNNNNTYEAGTISNDVSQRIGSIVNGTNNFFVVNGSKSAGQALTISFTTGGTLTIGANGITGGASGADLYISELLITTSDLSNATLLNNYDTYIQRWN